MAKIIDLTETMQKVRKALDEQRAADNLAYERLQAENQRLRAENNWLRKHTTLVVKAGIAANTAQQEE